MGQREEELGFCLRKEGVEAIVWKLSLMQSLQTTEQINCSAGIEYGKIDLKINAKMTNRLVYNID